MDETRNITIDGTSYTARITTLSDTSGSGVSIEITGPGVAFQAKKLEGQNQVIYVGGVNQGDTTSLELTKKFAQELYQTDDVRIES